MTETSASISAWQIADVLICLYGMAARMGLDPQAEVDKKMAINRARKWRMTGPGHGQHVEEGE